ncbi:hypothetical protein [Streptomyces minutiscleroticus]|uniref:Uncharacterized protein n=1 Tax=Streptomyces minutiscleroticus TaxID=68238 RepID=A0A918UA23_9ACTN|nr:hypothetical protein [Streptomyces minutiscleroticus]GGY14712.1 hypothetical protein GCM10010358_78440 [Streptomyces minutiscleroticus]
MTHATVRAVGTAEWVAHSSTEPRPTKVLNAAQAATVDATHITVISQLEGLAGTADIEDLFSAKDYLWLHNRPRHQSTRQS